MRKYISICVLCTLFLCTLVGCKDKNAPESFNGNVAQPAWSSPSGYDFTSSMTAVVKVDLAAQYPDIAADFALNNNDLLAAFSGDACLGVASPDEGFFFLYIGAPIDDTPSTVTLRYYSAHYKNIFEAKDAFQYISDTQQGTTAQPFRPAFVVLK